MAGAAPTAAPPARPGPSRAWAAPVWKPGDEWRFEWRSPTGSGSFGRRVEGEEVVDGVAHYVVKSGSRRIYYEKAAVGWPFEELDDAVGSRRSPPSAFPWPIRVGERWDLSYALERPREQQTEQVSRRCQAVDEPEVTVPAGSFVTLHVVCRNRADRVTSELWFAAEAKYWVKERLVVSGGERWQALCAYRVD